MWILKGFKALGFPNPDNSYSINLFMPKKSTKADEPSFESLKKDEDFMEFFKRCMPKVAEVIPNLEEQIANRKIGYLLETDIYPWSINNTCLIGDAAHAYQPFYGLGYNTTLEDFLCLEHFLNKFDNDFKKAFQAF